MASTNLLPGHGALTERKTGTNLLPGHGAVKETTAAAAPPNGPIVTLIS